MTKLDEVWMEYVENALGDDIHTAKFEGLRNSDTFGILWDFGQVYRDRMALLDTIEFDRKYDDAADQALIGYARAESTAGWQLLSAPTWRVLRERTMYCLVVTAVNMNLEDSITMHLPSGLTDRQKEVAVVLSYLLGYGRDVDQKVLRKFQTEQGGEFPSEFPAWKH